MYDEFAEAVDAALEKLKPGEFMIHKPADDGKIIYIGPRVWIGYPDEAERPKREAVMTYTSDDGLKKVTYAY